MSFDPLSSAFDLGKVAIERIWPDPIRRAEELRKLEELKQKGNLAELNATVKLMLGQLEVNKVEAGNKSLFVAGWRPFVGWVGGLSLAYSGIFYPLLTWVWAVGQANGLIPIALDQPPYIESDSLFVIVTGMLGIGGMRSFDKRIGTHTDSLGK